MRNIVRGGLALRGIFESLIVFVVMASILLPARLLFVEHVTDDWLGSFGIISVISAAVIILARKKKLGVFGHMFERQMYKFQKGKRGLVVFGESAILLLILGGMIFAIDQGNTTYAHLKPENIKNISPTSSPEQILEVTNELEDNEWWMGLIMTPVTFFTAFPEMSAIIASIDQKLDGWLMHFYTVGFVEYIELLGVLIFYRFAYKPKSNLAIKHVLISKTPI